MSSHNEQVKPAAFDVAAPVSSQTVADTTAGAQTDRPSWMIPALLGLGVLAVLVVFWLPGKVGPADIEPSAAIQTPEQTATAKQKKSKDQAEEASPWSDAQLAKMRKEAQDVLAEILEVQELLEGTGVELWAAEAFAQAKSFATEGDNQYRERQFTRATSSYQQALVGMNAILESEPDALEQQLAQARDYIEQGERELAESALAIAAAIEPNNDELRTLTARSKALEQLLPLLEQARVAEKNGDLATAEALLKEAATLDPQHRGTQAELARVSTAHTIMRFNDAMSEGYFALDERRFDAARGAFNRAAGLTPGSGEAASALMEVEAAKTADRLARLQTQGQSAEGKEQWQNAVDAYEQAIKIDSNIQYAQEGLQRSRIRAKLDRQFSSAIDAPERLADKAVAKATATLLRQAATISPRGSVLRGQIQRLEMLLEQANTPRSLTLRSDGETDVIVYKVVRLGQFQQHDLTLRPGKYTAVGTRNGYRDVRVSFTLTHDGTLPSVTISCTEEI
jgi:tetratricopeptide (TPR) repeat protein